MIEYEISENLKKTLKKTCKKDIVRYEAALKKIGEVVGCEDPNHYKNLRHNMKDLKRVHIDTHFVLTFRVDKNLKKVFFEDLDHHDKIYR
jgi:YafQ family addiction module toxin component